MPENRNMKKRFGFVLSVMLAFTLAACSGGSSSSGSSDADAGTAETVSAESESSEAVSTVSENPGDVYRAVVTDEDGSPVEGVGVKLCSDELCMNAKTDADGIAVFKNSQEGTYTVHVSRVPDGYAEDDTEYPAPETYGDVVIVLKAAG